MPYKYFDVEFHRIDQLFDLKVPINIFNEFVTVLGDKIKGSNFNKYYDPQRGIIHPRIQIRLNFESKDEDTIKGAVSKVAEGLENKGQIRYFDRELRVWDEPSFVIKAHEIGTICARELKNRMDDKPEIYEAFQRKRAQFMAHFVYLMMRHADFTIHVVWSLLRESPVSTEQIHDMAKSCAMAYRELMKEKPSSDFIERFLHAFINCTAPETEGTVLNWLLHSQFWNVLANSWR